MVRFALASCRRRLRFSFFSCLHVAAVARASFKLCNDSLSKKIKNYAKIDLVRLNLVISMVTLLSQESYDGTLLTLASFMLPIIIM